MKTEEKLPEPVEVPAPKVEIKVKPKPVKIKLEEIKPSHIVEVVKLFENSSRIAPMAYPSLAEETQNNMRSHIFQMISRPDYFGMVAYVGRKPVGQFGGFIQTRPFGMPRVYYSSWLFWVEPEFRKQGIAEALMAGVFAELKKRGVFNFEWLAGPELVSIYEKVYGSPLKVVSHRIVGKVT